ncbi:MAG: L,D-transpeptidase [Burkholderiaceae bacterium]|nr:L,D-transpeptidase [Burkholderiaceae bacterium]
MAVGLAASGLLLLQTLPSIATPVASLNGDAATLFQSVARSGDNQGLPFMIIDKRRAHLWVFDSSGRSLGDSPVLLGLARGDHTVPGIGDKKLSEIGPDERTTPAGRFLAEIGVNARGDDVVWVDYDSGVSMHRVLTTNPKEKRSQRLATPTPDDNRVSYGCINVPKAFYENVVSATVRSGNSVVYVLPETRPFQSVFGQLATASRSATP